jgi:light-harvesting complex II chlorophyll a/b binding protein 5
MQINALFKKTTPAPAKTVKKPTSPSIFKKPAAAPAPVKKPLFASPFKKTTAAPVKKTTAAPVKKTTASPFKKTTAPVKTKTTLIKKAAPAKAGSSDALSKWYGPNRKLYLPGGLITASELPSYLDGTLAGDYGFDPLGLGKDGAIAKYRVNEVLHARWAMLAIPGIVIPEALGLPGGNWTETGKVFLDGQTGRPEFLENPIIFAALNVVLMAGVEKFRSDGAGPSGIVPFKGKFEESAFDGLDPINPGGPLDFFNVAATPQDLAILKVKEIKNGRLAMIAMLGVFVQGLVTPDGPATNFGKHVSDPFSNNFVTITALERTPVL